MATPIDPTSAPIQPMAFDFRELLRRFSPANWRIPSVGGVRPLLQRPMSPLEAVGQHQAPADTGVPETPDYSALHGTRG